MFRKYFFYGGNNDIQEDGNEYLIEDSNTGGWWINKMTDDRPETLYDNDNNILYPNDDINLIDGYVATDADGKFWKKISLQNNIIWFEFFPFRYYRDIELYGNKYYFKDQEQNWWEENKRPEILYETVDEGDVLDPVNDSNLSDKYSAKDENGTDWKMRKLDDQIRWFKFYEESDDDEEQDDDDEENDDDEEQDEDDDEEQDEDDDEDEEDKSTEWTLLLDVEYINDDKLKVGSHIKILQTNDNIIHGKVKFIKKNGNDFVVTYKDMADNRYDKFFCENLEKKQDILFDTEFTDPATVQMQVLNKFYFKTRGKYKSKNLIKAANKAAKSLIRYKLKTRKITFADILGNDNDIKKFVLDNLKHVTFYYLNRMFTKYFRFHIRTLLFNRGDNEENDSIYMFLYNFLSVPIFIDEEEDDEFKANCEAILKISADPIILFSEEAYNCPNDVQNTFDKVFEFVNLDLKHDIQLDFNLNDNLNDTVNNFHEYYILKYTNILKPRYVQNLMDELYEILKKKKHTTLCDDFQNYFKIKTSFDEKLNDIDYIYQWKQYEYTFRFILMEKKTHFLRFFKFKIGKAKTLSELNIYQPKNSKRQITDIDFEIYHEVQLKTKSKKRKNVVEIDPNYFKDCFEYHDEDIFLRDKDEGINRKIKTYFNKDIIKAEQTKGKSRIEFYQNAFENEDDRTNKNISKNELKELNRFFKFKNDTIYYADSSESFGYETKHQRNLKVFIVDENNEISKQYRNYEFEEDTDIENIIKKVEEETQQDDFEIFKQSLQRLKNNETKNDLKNLYPDNLYNKDGFFTGENFGIYPTLINYKTFDCEKRNININGDFDKIERFVGFLVDWKEIKEKNNNINDLDFQFSQEPKYNTDFRLEDSEPRLLKAGTYKIIYYSIENMISQSQIFEIKERPRGLRERNQGDNGNNENGVQETKNEKGDEGKEETKGETSDGEGNNENNENNDSGVEETKGETSDYEGNNENNENGETSDGEGGDFNFDEFNREGNNENNENNDSGVEETKGETSGVEETEGETSDGSYNLEDLTLILDDLNLDEQSDGIIYDKLDKNIDLGQVFDEGDSDLQAELNSLGISDEFDSASSTSGSVTPELYFNIYDPSDNKTDFENTAPVNPQLMFIYAANSTNMGSNAKKDGGGSAKIATLKNSFGIITGFYDQNKQKQSGLETIVPGTQKTIKQHIDEQKEELSNILKDPNNQYEGLVFTADNNFEFGTYIFATAQGIDDVRKYITTILLEITNKPFVWFKFNVYNDFVHDANNVN